jgi:hypothetical protein
MPEGIFEALRHDWERVTDHLHHPGVTMTPETESPAQGAPGMGITQIVADFKTDLEEGEARIRTVLDQHLPGLLAEAEKGAEQLRDNRILRSAAAALHVPAPILDGFADIIDKLAADYAPEETAAAVTPPPAAAWPAQPAAAEPAQAPAQAV